MIVVKKIEDIRSLYRLACEFSFVQGTQIDFFYATRT